MPQAASTTPTKLFYRRASSQSGAPTAAPLDAGTANGAWARAPTVTRLAFVSSRHPRPRDTLSHARTTAAHRPIARRCRSTRTRTMAANTVPSGMEGERCTLEELAAIPVINGARLHIDPDSSQPSTALLEVRQ